MELNKTAREETIRYHESYYSNHKLFEEGWLQKPDDEIARIAGILKESASPVVLDIGCGVGRNAIALARELKSSGGRIECLDMLGSAIELLHGYAAQFGVGEQVVGRTVDMDELKIEPAKYDAILAISVLEHSRSQDSIRQILDQIVAGTKPGGINRLTMSTDRRATDYRTGEAIATRVETPMTKEEVQAMLDHAYRGWQIERLDLVPYREKLELEGRDVIWTCTDVSFLARFVV